MNWTNRALEGAPAVNPRPQPLADGDLSRRRAILGGAVLAATACAPSLGARPTARPSPRWAGSSPLAWEAYLAPSIPVVTRNLAPGNTRRMWPPTSSTLIFGERDAVLVDVLITVPQARALGEWVAAHGKNLTTIYATHGHGDHFLGASTILQRFPGARFVAWPGVVAAMRRQVSAQSLTTRWDAWFPGQISEHPVVAEPLSGNVISLEGTSLVVVPVGHTDTDDTTCLHVPSLGLVVAGDAVYNGVHLHLEESDQRGRRAWLAALAAIEALRPRVVIAGHKRPGNDDSPRTIEETRQYLRDFERANETTTTALALYEKMLERHGDRENPGALWSSARAAKG